MSGRSLKEEFEKNREKDSSRERDRQKSREEWENARRRFDRDRQYRRRSRSRSPTDRNSEERHYSRDRDRDRNYRRSRSRSPPHIGNFTNSDDPRYLNSRVFIGNLPTDKISREELEEIYKEYGPIMGISILRGFGFVQYRFEEDARKAVDSEAGGLLKGQRIDVRMAAEGRKASGGGRGGMRGGGGRGGSRGQEMGGRGHDLGSRERSPVRGDPYARERDLPGYDRMDDPYRRPVGGMGLPPARDPYADPYSLIYRRDPYADPLRDPYRDPYREVAPLPPARPAPVETAPTRPAYDCDIIHLDLNTRSYAEAVESRLRQSQMFAQIKLVHEEPDIPRAMDDANRKKLPYAIILRKQNEIHKSLTLNILHGSPQEHRNMPFEDALKLIARNFDTYMKEMREKAMKASALPTPSPAPLPPTRASPAPPVANPAPGGPKPDFALPDAETHYLLNLLADNRFLSLEEMDTVLKYLDARRDRLAVQHGQPTRKELIARETRVMKDESAINQQQEALKKNIYNILNGSEDEVMGGPSQAPAPSATASLAQNVSHLLGSKPPPPPPTRPDVNGQRGQAVGAGGDLTGINLDNPNVQKALDNLISSGSLLQNISSLSSTRATEGTPMQAQTSPNQGAYRQEQRSGAGGVPAGSTAAQMAARYATSPTGMQQSRFGGAQMQQQQQQQQQQHQQHQQQQQQHQQQQQQQHHQLHQQPPPPPPQQHYGMQGGQGQAHAQQHAQQQHAMARHQQSMQMAGMHHQAGQYQQRY